jgi:hypothetical protein
VVADDWVAAPGVYGACVLDVLDLDDEDPNTISNEEWALIDTVDAVDFMRLMFYAAVSVHGDVGHGHAHGGCMGTRMAATACIPAHEHASAKPLPTCALQFLSDEDTNAIDCAGYVCVALVAFWPNPMMDQSMLNWLRGALVQSILNGLPKLHRKVQDVLETAFVARLQAFREEHKVRCQWSGGKCAGCCSLPFLTMFFELPRVIRRPSLQPMMPPGLHMTRPSQQRTMMRR